VSRRSNGYGLAAFVAGVLLAALLAGCSAPAARHAADAVKREAQFISWLEAGQVPTDLGLVPASTTHALDMLRASKRGWEAQAYYLGSGPRPAWMPPAE
jgi:hypothetical protein